MRIRVRLQRLALLLLILLAAPLLSTIVQATTNMNAATSGQTYFVPYETPITIDLAADAGTPPYTYQIQYLNRGDAYFTESRLTYTPPDNYSGSAILYYRVTDADGTHIDTSVSFTIGMPLTLADQSVYTDYYQPIDITIQRSGGIGPYTYTILGAPDFGSLDGDLPAVTYTPNNDFAGEDTFTVQVEDGSGATDTAIISITVGTPLAVEDLAIDANALPQAFTLPVSGGLEPYTYNLITAPTNGTLEGTAPNLTYTANNGYAGPDALTYEVIDAFGNVGQITVNITVYGPISVPAGDTAAFVDAINTANNNTVADIIVLAADSTYTFTEAFEIRHSSISVSMSLLPEITSEITIMGNGATLTDSAIIGRHFTASETANLTINNLILRDGGGNNDGGAIRSRGVLTLDDVQFFNNRASSGGALSAIGQTTITNALFEDNSARDGGALTVGEGVSTITNSQFINNQADRGGGAIYARPIDADASLLLENITFTGNDANYADDMYADGNITIRNSQFTAGQNGALGAHSIDGFGGDIVIEDSIFTGYDVAVYPADRRDVFFEISNTCFWNNQIATSVDDVVINNWWGSVDGPSTETYNTGGDLVEMTTDQFEPFLTAPPRPECGSNPPAVITQNLITYENTSVDVTTLTRGGIPPLAVTAITNPANGTVTGTAPDLAYTPDPDFIGEDSFTYTVMDSTDKTSVNTIEILVVAQIPTLTTQRNVPLLDATLNPIPGSPPYTFGSYTQPANGLVVGDLPLISYVPDFDFVGVDTFTYDITDGSGTTTTVTIMVNVEDRPADIIVDTVETDVIDNGNCTIREASIAAYSKTSRDACPAGNVDGWTVIALPAGTITTANVRPADMTIFRGAGRDQTIIQSPDDADRSSVFELYSENDNVRFEGMTISNNPNGIYQYKDRGGAINAGDFVSNPRPGTGSIGVFNVNFERNLVDRAGHAIASYRSMDLYVVNSTFIDNGYIITTDISGGHTIAMGSGSSVTLINNAFFNNNTRSQANAEVVGGRYIAYNNCHISRSTQQFLSGPVVRAADLWYSYDYDTADPIPEPCASLDIPSMTITDGDTAAFVDAILYSHAFASSTIDLAVDGTYVFDTDLSTSVWVNSYVIPDIPDNLTLNGNGSRFALGPNVPEARYFSVSSAFNLNNLILTDIPLVQRTHDGFMIHVNGGTLNMHGVRIELDNGADGESTDNFLYAIDTHGTLNLTNSVFIGDGDTPRGTAIFSAHDERLYLEGNVFTQLVGPTIQMQANDEVITENNCFMETPNLSVVALDDVHFQNNWWGTSDGPGNVANNSGVMVDDDIIYEPFLTEIPEFCRPYVSTLRGIDETRIITTAAPTLDITVTALGGVPAYTFAPLSQPSNGLLSNNGATFTYTPNNGFTGLDSFTFQVTDTDGTTGTGTVTIDVRAENIIVDSTAQEVPPVDNGNCTLTEAIIAANTDTAVDACPAGNGFDIISLEANQTYTLDVPYATTNAPTSLPAIESKIALVGNGATITRNTTDGTPEFRILHVFNTGDLSLFDLTITNGTLVTSNGNYHGGGIWADGPLSLEAVTMMNNTTIRDGGAIYGESEVPIAISNSVIRDNSSRRAGAISARILQIDNTIIRNNTAQNGPGGVGLAPSSFSSITNSVIIENQATQGIGGIYVANGNAVTTFTDNLISDNVGELSHSFYADDVFIYNTQVVMTGNCFVTPGSSRALFFQIGSPEDAVIINNWWGSTTGPSGYGNGFGTTINTQPTSSLVYAPFLTTPPGGCRLFDASAYIVELHTSYETPITIPDLLPQVVDGVPPYTLSNPQASNGTFSGTLPDTLTYTPNIGFSGTDVMTYTITDSEGTQTIGQVNITVAPQLIALDQLLNTQHEAPLNITLGNTGGLPDYVFAITTEPSNGMRSPLIDGNSFTYTPNADFSGMDTIGFSVIDADGITDMGTITITVAGPVDALNVQASGIEGTGIAVQLRAIDGRTPYTYTVTSASTYGSIVDVGAQEDSQLLYIAPTNFAGTDSFTYMVTDANGDTATATVTIQVEYELAAVNKSVTVPRDAPTVITLEAVRGVPPYTFSNFSTPTNGTLEINGEQVTYMPTTGYIGGDSFTFDVADNEGRSASGIILIDVVEPIITQDDRFEALYQTPLIINEPGVLGNDIHLQGLQLTANLVTGPTFAQDFTLFADGSFTYTPQMGFSGEDSFTYTATDGMGISSETLVELFVFEESITPTPAPTFTPGPTTTWMPTFTPAPEETPEITPDVTFTPVPTDTPQPTLTPVPTDTPQAPTATPEPTATLVPTITPAPTSTPTGNVDSPGDFEISGALDAPLVRPQFTFVPLVDNADWHNIVIWQPGGKAVLDTWAQTADICDAQEICNYIPNSTDLPGGLINGDYLWAFRSWTQDRTMTQYTTATGFSVTAPIPAVPVFTVDTSTGRIKLVFAQNNTTAWLDIYIGRDGGGLLHRQWYRITDDLCTAGTCELLVDAHPGNGNYAIYARAWGAGGFNLNDSTRWSSAVAFTLDLPSATLPGGFTVISERDPVAFSWTASANATWYQVWLGDPPNGALHSVWYSAIDLGCETGGTCTFTLPNNLSANQPYIAYVRAWGPGGFSEGGFSGWAEGPSSGR